MRSKQTPREQRASALRRLEIEDLAREYRRVLGVDIDQPLVYYMVRETMMHRILDKEFGAGAEGHEAQHLASLVGR